jgi:hypothetical protein
MSDNDIMGAVRMRTFLILGALLFFLSCEEGKEHVVPAIHERDSVSVMTSYGVNTLISDSGIIKYRIVTDGMSIKSSSQRVGLS